MGDKEKTYSITLDNYDEYTIGDGTYSIDSNFTSYNYDNTISTVDISSITFDNNWNPNNGKYIDFDVLDKYPTAKTLYNQFISVYNMCEEDEKLNGE
jgi:predicted NUDIX family NTP pyrophosphohydrolase